ncbi:MAG: beta-phosphoglucomutase [Cyclobacteriaceae bacterium]|nr:beta-phosphoglucomutase [Cyclobacteriaceae bacterium]
MIKACIFDLDGVVVDTAKYHYLAWKRLAAEFGFEFMEIHNERLKGVSRMRSLEILLEVGGINMSAGEKERAAARKNQWYVEYISEMTPAEILPGVTQFLDYLKSIDMKIALGSASKNAGMILERTNLASVFDAVIDGKKVSKAKPDPEVFIKGAEALGIFKAEECLVFEDAEAGVEAALSAGMYCIGIGSPKILQKAHKVIPGFQGVQPADLLRF